MGGAKRYPSCPEQRRWVSRRAQPIQRSSFGSAQMTSSRRARLSARLEGRATGLIVAAACVAGSSHHEGVKAVGRIGRQHNPPSHSSLRTNGNDDVVSPKGGSPGDLPDGQISELLSSPICKNIPLLR